MTNDGEHQASRRRDAASIEPDGSGRNANGHQDNAPSAWLVGRLPPGRTYAGAHHLVGALLRPFDEERELLPVVCRLDARAFLDRHSCGVTLKFRDGF